MGCSWPSCTAFFEDAEGVLHPLRTRSAFMGRVVLPDQPPPKRFGFDRRVFVMFVHVKGRPRLAVRVMPEDYLFRERNQLRRLRVPFFLPCLTVWRQRADIGTRVLVGEAAQGLGGFDRIPAF